MRKTKIVATIGPASQSPEVFETLIKAGMNVMRLNFSHGDHEEHLGKVETLKILNKKLGTNVAFLLDTKGPEIRTGVFEDDQKHNFLKGTQVIITIDDVPCTDNIISVTYKDLPKDVEVGGHILMRDASIDFLIQKIDGNNIECTVQNDGTLGNRNNVNVPGATLNLQAITQKDIEDIQFAVDNNFDYIAASFIRKPQDVIEIRNLLKELGDENIKIISKIENQEGLNNFDEILKVTDGIMVARGDLGSEIDIATVPLVQKMMIKKCIAAGKLVITATQMLESMQKNPRPTRAEVSDVANAIYDGTSAIMLSGESAQGDYPLECVKMMDRIAKATELDINYAKRFRTRNIDHLHNCSCPNKPESSSMEDAKLKFKRHSNFSACCSALFSNAAAIVVITEKGEAPAILSSFRPVCPIYVITTNVNTYRQMSLEFGVNAVLIPEETEFSGVLNVGIAALKEKSLLKDGDTVILSDDLTQATGTIIKV